MSYKKIHEERHITTLYNELATLSSFLSFIYCEGLNFYLEVMKEHDASLADVALTELDAWNNCSRYFDYSEWYVLVHQIDEVLQRIAAYEPGLLNMLTLASNYAPLRDPNKAKDFFQRLRSWAGTKLAEFKAKRFEETEHFASNYDRMFTLKHFLINVAERTALQDQVAIGPAEVYLQHIFDIEYLGYIERLYIQLNTVLSWPPAKLQTFVKEWAKRDMSPEECTMWLGNIREYYGHILAEYLDDMSEIENIRVV